MMMPGMTGIELIIQLRQRQCTTQIVMVTAHAPVATAVEAMRHGAFDYIEKPFEADALERLVSQAMRHGRLIHPEPADALAMADANSPAMIGSSPTMQALRVTADGLRGRELPGTLCLSPRMDNKSLWNDHPSERLDTKTREVWIELDNLPSVVGLHHDVVIDPSSC